MRLKMLSRRTARGQTRQGESNRGIAVGSLFENNLEHNRGESTCTLRVTNDCVRFVSDQKMCGEEARHITQYSVEFSTTAMKQAFLVA